MPYLDLGDARIHYTDEGAGDETIVFSHGLLLSGRMFASQVAHLKGRYRCITFDHRGQGKSKVTKDGYDMDSLTEDAARLIEALDAAPCHFVGLSMGGFVGLRLAFRRPELLRSLTLIETSADPESGENKPRYRLLNFIARWFGIGIVVGKVMPILFGRGFLTDQARAGERAAWRQVIAANDRIGITRAVRGVIERKGVSEEIGRINLPVLIVVGDQDVATIPEKAERMHAAIQDSKLVTIPNAGHSSTIEEPQAVNSAISAFLDELNQH
jgi:3-oxoadipate enol-lactonase